MADPATISTQFTQFYYSVFDSDRKSLGSLYRPTSMMTWEGQQISGVDSILEKLESLPFQKVEHNIITIDAQPSSPTVASLLVTVMGHLKVDDGEHPLQFAQTFHLIPEAGSYYVQNDMFRLNLG